MTPEPNHPDDRALVEQFLRTRSEAAFLALYDRHADALFRFAARLCGRGGEEPAELTQETWLRALAALDAFRWESSLRTWLCGIALNQWRAARAKDERRARLTLVEGPGPGSAHPDPLRGVELERALAALPAGGREVLLLHDVEGYTHEEIARHFGVAAGTSKSQLHRARRALREGLEPKGEIEHG